MTELEQAVLAADLRECFLDVASAAWKARDAGLSEDQALVIVAAAMEGLVQSIVRRAADD